MTPEQLNTLRFLCRTIREERAKAESFERRGDADSASAHRIKEQAAVDLLISQVEFICINDSVPQ